MVVENITTGRLTKGIVSPATSSWFTNKSRSGPPYLKLPTDMATPMNDKVLQTSRELNELLKSQAIDPPADGLYEDIPAAVYHRWRGASQSRLLTLRDKSPAHMKWEQEHPAEETPTFALGNAVHTAVLQPDIFSARYVRDVEGDARTKAVKEKRAALRQERPDAIILRATDFDVCLAIRDAVAAHPIAGALLDGPAERSAVWTDPQTGVTCKARFDQKPNGIDTITDLKTTTDASATAFTRSIYRFGYYIQGAHYLSGAQTLELDARFFTIIAVEKEPPWGVAVYHLRDDAIQAGADELRPLLETYARCEVTGHWPAYEAKAVEISLPPFAWQQIDERVGR